MGRPQRGQRGRPAPSTVSACFEKATTCLWLSQNAGAFLAGRALARDQNEHAAVLVVPETHFADLPLGLAGLQARLTRCRCDPFETLRFDHLLEPDEERLDLRFLAAQSERPPRAAGEQEELAPPWLADRRDGDLLRRIELEDGHLSKPSWMVFRGPKHGEEDQELKIEIRADNRAWRNHKCRKP